MNRDRTPAGTTSSVDPRPAVRTEVTGQVLVITIDRPQVRNAINREASEGIRAALDELDTAQELRAAVLTGAAGVFSAGMDLKAFPAEGVPVAGDRGFGGITARPPAKPIIAAVEGYALAGGFEIALATDLIVASRTAEFALPEVQRGLLAAAGGLVRLGLALPYQTAMLLALTGDRMNAEQLAQLGLIAALTEPGEALESAIALAERVASNAPLAVRASKQLVRAAAAWTDAELFAEQDAVSSAVIASADALEGARAFAERRPARWLGR